MKDSPASGFREAMLVSSSVKLSDPTGASSSAALRLDGVCLDMLLSVLIMMQEIV